MTGYRTWKNKAFPTKELLETYDFWHSSIEINQKLSFQSLLHFSGFLSGPFSLVPSALFWSTSLLLSPQLVSPLMFCFTGPNSGLGFAASSPCTHSSCPAFCFGTLLGSLCIGRPSSSCLTELKGTALGLSGRRMGVSISSSSTFTCTAQTTKSQKNKFRSSVTCENKKG